MKTQTKHIKIPRDSLIRLQQYEEKTVIVKFAGGRQISGLLRSFDRQLNLTLDHAIEILREDLAPAGSSGEVKRELGFMIVRGSLVIFSLKEIHTIGPQDGSEEIENPFLGE